MMEAEGISSLSIIYFKKKYLMMLINKERGQWTIIIVTRIILRLKKSY